MPPPNDDHLPGTRSSDDLRGLQILLVEDSLDIGELVKSFLELEGVIVAGPATTVAEAKRLMAERRPHAALVDFHLRRQCPWSDRPAARIKCAGHHDLGLDRVSSADVAHGGSDLEKPFTEASGASAH